MFTRKRKSKMFSLAIAVATVIALSCLTAGSASAQNVKPSAPAVKPSANEVTEEIELSTKFRADASGGKIPADKILIGWQGEKSRIERLLQLIKGQQPIHPQCEEIVNRGKEADFKLAEILNQRLTEMQLMSQERALAHLQTIGEVEGFQEQMADLKMKRADNLVLMGNDPQATKLLEEALQFAQAGVYARHAEEGAIRMRLAGVHCRAEHWAKSAEQARAAISILTPLAAKPKANEKEQLLTALWYAAISNSCLGAGNQVQKDISAFLALAGKDTAPREADIYKQVLGLRTTQSVKDSPMLIPVRRRYATLLTDLQRTAAAQEQLKELKRLQSLPKTKK